MEKTMNMSIKKIILSFFSKAGYLLFEEKMFRNQYRLKSDFEPLEQLFYQKLHPNFFFVQIGANDGKSFDPIYHLVTRENVRGIALEPVPTIFNLLKENYTAYPRVLPVNKAIHKSEREMVLYRVDPDNKLYPDWTKGTSSFNKSHHELGHISKSDIIEERVQCVSFEELLEDHKITHIDLLQIDTEGYDYDIIKMIDFNKIAPSIISFEHGVSLGIMSWEKLAEIQKLLVMYNYSLIMMENDMIAHK
jgi:FkbM family methyltransferase